MHAERGRAEVGGAGECSRLAPAHPSREPIAREVLAFIRYVAAFVGRRGMAAAGLVMAGALVEGIGILLLVPLLFIVFPTEGAADAGTLAATLGHVFDRLGVTGGQGRLALLLLAFAVLVAARAFILQARDIALARLQSDFVAQQRLRVIARLAYAPWDRMAGLERADVTQMLGEDVQRVGAGTHYLIQSGVSGILLLSQVIIALLLAPLPALFAISFLGIAAASLHRLAISARSLGGGALRAQLNLLGRTEGFVGGLKLAVAQNMQSGFLRDFTEIQDVLRRNQVDFVRQQGRAKLLLAAISFSVAGGALLFGQWLELPGPLLVTLLVVIARMGAPVAQLQQALQQISFALPSCRRLWSLNEMFGAAREPVASSSLSFSGPIRMESVSLKRRGGGLESVSLCIEPGEIVALTGPSGTGKTSLADILAGLAWPDGGSVSIGEVELTPSSAHAWRDRLGYVPQDPYLLHDTIRRNLSWGNADERGEVDEARLWWALEQVGAVQLVRRLDRGLDEVVGDRGRLLSGGERQRIAIARVVLRDMHLLILDEATGALDTESERDILAALRRLPERPAVLMIAHRTENLDLCDRVLVLREGCVQGG